MYLPEVKRFESDIRDFRKVNENPSQKLKVTTFVQESTTQCGSEFLYTSADEHLWTSKHRIGAELMS